MSFKIGFTAETENESKRNIENIPVQTETPVAKKSVVEVFFPDKVLELANSILEAHITDTEESVDNSAQIEDYKRELERVSRRIDNLIEMRSDGEIDKADFIKRKTDAEQKHMELQNKIAELETEQNKTTPVIDYKEKLEVLRYALEQYTDFDTDGDIPDSVIEAFVEKIVVSKDGYDWYLRFDGDPNDPLHLKTEGKRRKNTAIIDPNKQTACEPVRNTGCYQRKQIIDDFMKQANLQRILGGDLLAFFGFLCYYMQNL